jgi:ribosomal protein S12 methylthiotransferase accessory factor
MNIKITFEGNKKINAHVNGHVIKTDQPSHSGGENTAPAPYDLFLASLGTCAGIYVKSFCDQRGISTDGISLDQTMEWDAVAKKMGQITITIQLPATFPDKYKESLVKVAELCAVKKTIQDPPIMIVNTSIQ